MTAEEALEAVRGYSTAHRIDTPSHVRQRMRERGVQYEDLRHALANASTCTRQVNERWRVEGTDLDGDDLAMVVVIDDGLIVVTLF